jgi:hypothetical protein
VDQKLNIQVLHHKRENGLKSSVSKKQFDLQYYILRKEYKVNFVHQIQLLDNNHHFDKDKYTTKDREYLIQDLIDFEDEPGYKYDQIRDQYVYDEWDININN